MNINKKIISSPVNIPQSGLSISVDELYAIIIERWTIAKGEQ